MTNFKVLYGQQAWDQREQLKREEEMRFFFFAISIVMAFLMIICMAFVMM